MVKHDRTERGGDDLLTDLIPSTEFPTYPNKTIESYLFATCLSSWRNFANADTGLLLLLLTVLVVTENGRRIITTIPCLIVLLNTFRGCSCGSSITSCCFPSLGNHFWNTRRNATINYILNELNSNTKAASINNRSTLLSINNKSAQFGWWYWTNSTQPLISPFSDEGHGVCVRVTIRLVIKILGTTFRGTTKKLKQ